MVVVLVVFVVVVEPYQLLFDSSVWNQLKPRMRTYSHLATPDGRSEKSDCIGDKRKQPDIIRTDCGPDTVQVNYSDWLIAAISDTLMGQIATVRCGIRQHSDARGGA